MHESKLPWHEDPQFWEELRDGIFDEALWAAADFEVTQMLALVQPPSLRLFSTFRAAQVGI